jgi:hypothetical protein
LDMWRANTDTPKKQTRQITEESFGTAQMFYEIPSAIGKDTTDPSGLVGNKTVTGSAPAGEVPSPATIPRRDCSLMCYFMKPS